VKGSGGGQLACRIRRRTGLRRAVRRHIGNTGARVWVPHRMQNLRSRFSVWHFGQRMRPPVRQSLSESSAQHERPKHGSGNARSAYHQNGQAARCRWSRVTDLLPHRRGRGVRRFACPVTVRERKASGCVGPHHRYNTLARRTGDANRQSGVRVALALTVPISHLIVTTASLLGVAHAARLRARPSPSPARRPGGSSGGPRIGQRQSQRGAQVQ